MSKERMILVAGWAHSEDDLADLSSLLSPRFDIQATSTAALFSGPAASRQSPHPASTYATALRAMINKSKESATLVTWSMGALVALESISTPATGINRLIIISGTARFCSARDYQHGIPEQNLRAMTANLSGKPSETLKAFFNDAMFPAANTAQLAGKRASKAIQLGIDCLKDGLVYLRRTDLRRKLPEISVPTLILHGAQDRIIPASAAEFLHRNITSSRLTIHAGEGHTLILDHPALIAEDIRTFIEG